MSTEQKNRSNRKHKSSNYQRKGSYQHKHGRQQKQPRPLPWTSYEGLLHRFMACVNCGYFMTAYRAYHGSDVLKSALDQSNERRDGWLHLPWNSETGRLIHRFYEVRSDLGGSHIEFMCGDCQRKFLYSVTEVEPTIDHHTAEQTNDTERGELDRNINETIDHLDETNSESSVSSNDAAIEGEAPPSTPHTEILFQIEIKLR